jgi:hypothetical protein
LINFGVYSPIISYYALSPKWVLVIMSKDFKEVRPIG